MYGLSKVSPQIEGTKKPQRVRIVKRRDGYVGRTTLPYIQGFKRKVLDKF